MWLSEKQHPLLGDNLLIFLCICYWNFNKNNKTNSVTVHSYCSVVRTSYHPRLMNPARVAVSNVCTVGFTQIRLPISPFSKQHYDHQICQILSIFLVIYGVQA